MLHSYPPPCQHLHLYSDIIDSDVLTINYVDLFILINVSFFINSDFGSSSTTGQGFAVTKTSCMLKNKT